jgi:glutathione S-transferase
MHSGFMKLREGMSFNLCFLPKRPATTPEATADAKEMLGFFEDALKAKKSAGPYLFGEFGGVDAMYAPAAVRLVAFEVPTKETPRAGDYLKALLAAPAVAPWMTAARALPPAETY